MFIIRWHVPEVEPPATPQPIPLPELTVKDSGSSRGEYSTVVSPRDSVVDSAG